MDVQPPFADVGQAGQDGGLQGVLPGCLEVGRWQPGLPGGLT